MPRWAVFLRGVNVGGHGRLPMKPFCAALQEAGFAGARHYIQSGNIALNSDLSATAIRDSILALMLDQFDLDRPVFVICAEDLDALIARCPNMAHEAPGSLMVYLHAGTADIAPLLPRAAPSEEIVAINGATLLWAPNGIGKSRLAAAADRKLPQPVTARNLRTLLALQSLLSG